MYWSRIVICKVKWKKKNIFKCSWKLFSKILYLALHEKKTILDFSKKLKDFNETSSLASDSQRKLCLNSKKSISKVPNSHFYGHWFFCDSNIQNLTQIPLFTKVWGDFIKISVYLSDIRKSPNLLSKKKKNTNMF